MIGLNFQQSHNQTVPYTQLGRDVCDVAAYEAYPFITRRVLIIPYQEWSWIYTGTIPAISPYYLGGCI